MADNRGGNGPQPRRPRILNRMVTTLSRTVTQATGDDGDLNSWNPALGYVHTHDAGLQAPNGDDVVRTRTSGPSLTTSRPTRMDKAEDDMEQRDWTSSQSESRGRTMDTISGWRLFILNLTPSWFTITMGTGIVAILLNQFPYQARWLYWLSVIVFVLNSALFLFFLLLSILRYTLFPESWVELARIPNLAFFLSAVPMSLSTITNMTVFVCVPAWGEWVIYLAWGLWITSATLSLLCALWLPFLLISTPSSSTLSSFTAVQLFPVIATVVAAASGAIVASVIPRPEQALVTILTSYILWGIGIPTAMFILVIYLSRLAFHSLPPKELIVSCFIPLGPFGMGAFAIMRLGAVAMKIFPETATIHPLAGPLAYNLGVLLALVMWGFGILWLFLAVAGIWHAKHFPFNMGWWSFVFPVGTFALSSGTLAKDLPSRFFRVITAISSVCVVLLWLLVAAATVRDLVTGGKSLFLARKTPIPMPLDQGVVVPQKRKDDMEKGRQGGKNA